MKKYFGMFDKSTIYVGEAWEVKAVYNSIMHALDHACKARRNFHMFPGTLRKPTFKEGRLYSLCIEGSGDVLVFGEDAVARMLFEEGVVKA